MSSLMTDINNFSFTENYLKPKLSTIDIDVDDIIMNDEGVVVKIENLETINNIRCDVYKMILQKDYDSLRRYAESSYMQTNTKRQTPLMLACKLGDVEAVKILLNEVGNISLNHKTAMDYAIENGSHEIINMLIRYEKMPSLKDIRNEICLNEVKETKILETEISETKISEKISETKPIEKISETKVSETKIPQKNSPPRTPLSQTPPRQNSPRQKSPPRTPPRQNSPRQKSHPRTPPKTSKQISSPKAQMTLSINPIHRGSNSNYDQLLFKLEYINSNFDDDIVKLQKLNELLNKSYGIRPFEIYYVDKKPDVDLGKK